jgi:nucleoid DNA-binding protein
MYVVTRKDLVRVVYGLIPNVREDTVDQTVTTVFDAITAELQLGHSVRIAGFGEFSPKTRSSRKGVNPQNPSERIDVPARTVPKFRAFSTLKRMLNGSR